MQGGACRLRAPLFSWIAGKGCVKVHQTSKKHMPRQTLKIQGVSIFIHASDLAISNVNT